MPIQSITLKNYRSYKEASFEFDLGITIIIGPNACGKTNLLEAVYMLAQGSSFRVSDKDVVKHSMQWSRIESVFSGNERVLKLESGIPKTKKTFVINGNNKARLGFDDILPVVLFEPDDIRLVSGSPERRRSYLNDLLTQTVPLYKKTLLSYNRALKQRNTLLKKGATKNTLFAWNVIMARSASEIVKWRLQAIEEINKNITKVYCDIAGKKHHIRVTYSGIVEGDYMSYMLKKLEINTELDKARGYTGFGPHRDDLLIEIDDRLANLTASRGETRTITLALKVIEMKMIEASRGIQPILLLDDVFSELDGTRRKKLTSFLSGHQAIITTTDADVVGKNFIQTAQIVSLG
ncbi:DNA replication/repair protein RecF [Candidatus Saccharibacteria bacterium]|nr:DNA replication/repair protein RecF [Candidatus Saccharibacteria bacterium]